MFEDRDEGWGLATEAEAHAEWHRNAGVPMGTPGCPWDACHDEDSWRDEDPDDDDEGDIAVSVAAPIDDGDIPF